MGGSSFLLIFIGNIAMALLTTIIFGRWANIKTFATGLKAGAVIGLLAGAYYAFVAMGTTHLHTTTSAIADIVLSTIIGAAVGGVVGLILGKTAD